MAVAVEGVGARGGEGVMPQRRHLAPRWWAHWEEAGALCRDTNGRRRWRGRRGGCAQSSVAPEAVANGGGRMTWRACQQDQHTCRCQRTPAPFAAARATGGSCSPCCHGTAKSRAGHDLPSGRRREEQATPSTPSSQSQQGPRRTLPTSDAHIRAPTSSRAAGEQATRGEAHHPLEQVSAGAAQHGQSQVLR